MDSKQFWASLRATVAKSFADDPLESMVVASLFVLFACLALGGSAALVVSAFKGTPR